MTKKISGAEYQISKIFSSEFDYEIPSYQRPYAWTVDQASELYDDLYDFFRREQERPPADIPAATHTLPSSRNDLRQDAPLDWRTFTYGGQERRLTCFQCEVGLQVSVDKS